MKRLVKLILIISSVAVLSSCGYNSGVEKQEAVDKQWAQVENVYQRRMDLIPNLVNTVKGAANFEKSTLTAVIEAHGLDLKTEMLGRGFGHRDRLKQLRKEWCSSKI